MKHPLILPLLSLLLIACGPSDQQQAQSRLDQAKSLVLEDRLNQAKIQLDSIHILYPREVAVRRQARILADTIDYVESQRTLIYSDSLLQTLLPQVDPLLKRFRYERDDRYEQDGRYVHRLLNTDSNTARCFLQAYVSDKRLTTLKSYYYGAATLIQSDLHLSADDMELHMQGSEHHFDAEGFHSILTLEQEKALQTLAFIDGFADRRIRINLIGTSATEKSTNYVYYLSDNEKQALRDTYQLGFLMNDIRQLEENIRIASAHIERYERHAN